MIDRLKHIPLRDGLLEEWQNAWSRQDIEGICAFFTEELQFEDVPLGLQAHTLEEFRNGILVPTFAMIPDFGMEILDAHEGAGFVVTKWKITGTATFKTERFDVKDFPFESIVTSIIQFDEEGKIRALSDNWDCSVFYRS